MYLIYYEMMQLDILDIIWDYILLQLFFVINVISSTFYVTFPAFVPVIEASSAINVIT